MAMSGRHVGHDSRYPRCPRYPGGLVVGFRDETSEVHPVAGQPGGPVRVVDARCPLRPSQPCSLCVPGADGPGNCPTVALVMQDDELRGELAALRARVRERARLGGAARPGSGVG